MGKVTKPSRALKLAAEIHQILLQNIFPQVGKVTKPSRALKQSSTPPPGDSESAGGKSHQALAGIETGAGVAVGQTGSKPPVGKVTKPSRALKHVVFQPVYTMPPFVGKVTKPSRALKRGFPWRWGVPRVRECGKSHQALAGIETLPRSGARWGEQLPRWEKSPSPRGH